RFARGGVAAARIGGALQPHVERSSATRLLVAGDHLLQLALAHERALLELLGVEAEQGLADRELVAALAEARSDLLAAIVPHLDRAALEIAPDRDRLAPGLELELDAERSAVPRPPALE